MLRLYPETRATFFSETLPFIVGRVFGTAKECKQCLEDACPWKRRVFCGQRVYFNVRTHEIVRTMPEELR